MSGQHNVIYVAGDWVNFASARETAEFLEQNGYTIAHKWWEPEARQQTSGNIEFLRGQIERSAAFVMDIRGVPEGRANAGGHIGMGLAFARKIPVCFLGKPLSSLYGSRICLTNEGMLLELNAALRCNQE